MDFNDVFKMVGLIVCWGVAIILGLVIFLTLANGIIAFASTGVGAIVLALVGWKLWKNYMADK